MMITTTFIELRSYEVLSMDSGFCKTKEEQKLNYPKLDKMG